MCTVSIKVDDEKMSRIDPSLNSLDSICRWLQHHVDVLIEEKMAENDETIVFDATGDMTVEQLYATIEQDIKAIYAND